MFAVTYMAAALYDNLVGVPMGGSFVSSGRGFYATVLGVLLAATCPASAQQLRSATPNTPELPDAPSAVTVRSDTKKDLNFLAKVSSVSQILDASSSQWWMSSYRNRTQSRPDIGLQLLENRDLARDEHPILSARAAWVSFLPTYSLARPKTVHNLDDWQYYGHHIPVAGPVVLRVGQEALAHPHLVSVFKVIQPQLF